MKKVLFIFLSLIAVHLNAQTKMTKDSLIKLMSDDVCIEMNKMVKEKREIKDLETQLGLAMLPAFGKYMNEIREIYGIENLDEKFGEMIGEDVGGYLAKSCPAFLEILTSNSDATAELISGKKSDKNTGTVKGTFQKITYNDFSYVEIKTATGKIEKLYWMEYFAGASDLTNNPSKFANKNVTIKYTEKEIYKAALKDYVKLKFMSGIEIN
jgi:hypothetical protein